MKSPCNRSFLFALAGAVAVTSASAQTVISDSFEVDSSADYTLVNDGSVDSTQTFAFDYVAAGIPLAPRSNAGDTKGLRMTANDTAGVEDSATLFHNTSVVLPHYRVTVDVWMNFVGTAGTTEHAHVGVGSDASTVNQLFSPILGEGAYIAFTGDGGSVSDYRWFRDPDNTPPGDTQNTTLPNDHPSYLGHGSNGTGAFFQSLFPAPPSTIAGSPGNIWTTLEIDVDNVAGVISFYFDGALTFQGDFANTFDGFVSLGMADVFPSISLNSNFALYDNLVVDVPSGSIGTNYCTPAVQNSTGAPTSIIANGSTLVADNNVTLSAVDMPLMAFAYFLTSQTQATVMNPGGSQGTLCLGGMIGRFVGPGQIQNSGTLGSVSLAIDLSIQPTPTGLVQVMPGETWNFQCWHRDSVMGTATSNFSDGVEITFN